MKSKAMNKMQWTLHSQALKAMKEAVVQVIEEHRQRNLPLALWKNGKVRMVPPSQVYKRKTIA